MTYRRTMLFLRCTVISAMVLHVTGCVNENTFLPNYEQNVLVEAPDTPDLKPHPPVVSNKHVSLSQLSMNGQGDQVIIKPGIAVHATLQYAFHCPSCRSDLNSQIIIGLANRSAQACIYNGGPEAQGRADFMLKVPAKPGKYDVRFRGLQASDCQEALKAGWDADTSPSKDATIGRIIVSKKADVVTASQKNETLPLIIPRG